MVSLHIFNYINSNDFTPFYIYTLLNTTPPRSRAQAKMLKYRLLQQGVLKWSFHLEICSDLASPKNDNIPPHPLLPVTGKENCNKVTNLVEFGGASHLVLLLSELLGTKDETPRIRLFCTISGSKLSCRSSKTPCWGCHSRLGPTKSRLLWCNPFREGK